MSDIQRLVASATAAQKKAYCPYSNFPVGAAVLAESGRIYAGCNVETAATNLGTCAERVAIFLAVAAGERKISAICVVGRGASPCGACRQVLSEFADDGATVYCVDTTAGTRAKPVKSTLGKLLPHKFSARSLKI